MEEVGGQSHTNIRKIEDIIDIQKATGNFSVRQVAFNIPSDVESTLSATIAKSLETGLLKTKGVEKKKYKKRSKRHKSPLTDVISWPSDSDITVLRMKICLTKDLKDNVGNIFLGDGLHQPDSSSMVNLATLMNLTQPPSKESIIEEYLLPLTSWGQDQDPSCDTGLKTSVAEHKCSQRSSQTENNEISTHHKFNANNNMFYNDTEYRLQTNKKSKIARFLRLYFFPCCTCLYRMEEMSDEPAVYWRKRRNITSKTSCV